MMPRDPFDVGGPGPAKRTLADALTSMEAGRDGTDFAKRPVVICMRDVRPEPVEWLWPQRIAVGKLTLLVGNAGLGKSFVTIDLAARVSRGRGWPDEDRPEPRDPGGVVMLNCEDAAADTIRPRLDSADADCARVHLLDTIRDDRGVRLFDLGRDLDALDDVIAGVEECRLVVIDPISAYLGATDSHKNGEIRGLLGPLAALAERRRVAILGVSHLNKSVGGEAIHRTLGSVGFVAASRAVWLIARDKADPGLKLFVPIKSNLGADVGGLTFKVGAPAAGGGASVTWHGPTSETADSALGPQRDDYGEASELADAMALLRHLLAAGPVATRSVEQDARAAGISGATLRRAKARLGVVASKSGFDGGWVWSLPAEGAQETPKALISRE